MSGQHDNGRLETSLAKQFYRFAPIHVRQTDIHDQQIDDTVSRHLNTLGRVVFLNDLKFFIKAQLLNQYGPQVCVVVDDKNGTRCHQISREWKEVVGI